MEAALAAAGGFEVVGTGQNAVDTIALGRKLRPDLAVLDFDLPDATGLEIFLELGRWSPDTKTAIITGITVKETLMQVVAAGVHGLFLKGENPDSICEGLRRVAQGERVLPPGFGDDAATLNLSAREIEVLLAISRGLSNKQVGDSLSISPKTVESHRASLMRKLGVHSTAELVVAAVRAGYLKI